MKSTALFAVLAALVLSLGCATDPNKQVVAADAAHAADVRDSRAEQDNLEAQQTKDHAALDATHEKQDGSMDKKIADDASKSNKEHVAAEANVVEARRSFRASATARLDQVEVKTAVLEKAAKKGAAPMVTAVRTHLAKAKASLKSLDDVADAGWFNAKTSVEADIVALEKHLTEAESK